MEMSGQPHARTTLSRGKNPSRPTFGIGRWLAFRDSLQGAEERNALAPTWTRTPYNPIPSLVTVLTSVPRLPKMKVIIIIIIKTFYSLWSTEEFPGIAVSNNPLDLVP